MGCVVCRFFLFFYYDQMKKTQRSLSLSTHPLLCFGRTGLEEKPDPVRVEIRAGHPTPLRGPTVLGNAPLLSSSPSLPLASVPLSPPLFPPSFPSPHLSPSSPPPPDTRHSAASRVSPFSSVASLLWQLCCSAVVYRLHILSPAFLAPTSALALGPQWNGSLPCLLDFLLCVSGRVCGWGRAGGIISS